MPITDFDEQDRLETGREIVRQLALKFQANLPYYLSNQFDETSTRTQFLEPFFAALGWDMNDTLRKGAFADVIRERSVVGEVAGVNVLLKPDYTFRVGGQPQVCIEAKRPGVEIDAIDRIYQVKNYAWNQSLTVGVLTNFRQLRVFATSSPPDLAKPWEGDLEGLHLSFDKFADSFDEIWNVLSYDAARRGGLAQTALAALGKTVGQRVDKAFLADLERWRLLVARDLAHQTSLSGWELTEVSQLLLDRMVFIRVCEDRNIEPKPVLRPLIEAADIRGDLQTITARLNVQYNGTLFKQHLVDVAPMSDQLLRDLIPRLYPPMSPYRFDVINVEILGTIYERFLGNEIVRAPDGQVKSVKRPEVRKAGGVYYTPQWVVDEIVRMAVEPLVAGKSPGQLAKVKILDPACGSGSFLLGAFNRIVREYESYYSAHPTVTPRDHYQSIDGRRRLTERKKAQILVDNIFGVDVDLQAVQVTMMSLYLKALEGEDSTSLSNQRGAQTSLLQVALLPPLDRNIVCGNSLVSADGFQMELAGLDSEDLRKLNPFDWLDPAYGFRDVVQAGGFDAVIGNPPYFNVDSSYGRNHPMLDYLRNHYPEVWQDKTDILFYFLAKGTQLTKRFVGFIVSRAFMEAYKAARLRETLVRTAPCVELIDFQGFRVFTEAGISTAIVVLDHSKAGTQPTTSVRRLSPGAHPLGTVMAAVRDGSAPFERFETRLDATGDPWLLVKDSERELIDLLNGAWPQLGDIATVGQGMQTGENNAFAVTDKIASNLKIPAQLLKRRVRNSDVERFGYTLRDESLLYLEDVLVYELLPSALRALLEQPGRQSLLKSRAAFVRGDCLWWRYTWPLHKELYGLPRLICPYRASYNRFMLDSGFEVLSLTDTTVVFPNSDRKEHATYWLGLLNSRTLSYRMRHLAKLTGQGMYEYFWNAVAQLPARTIDFTSQADIAAHGRVVRLVTEIINLSSQLKVERSPSGRAVLQRRVATADRALEEIILDLYSVTDAPARAEILGLFEPV